MKIMRKTLSLLLAVAMLFVFTGCGSSEQTKESTESGAKESDAGSFGQSNAEQEADIPTLIWVVPGDAQADTEAVVEKVNEIAAREIGVKIELQFIDQPSFAQKMSMMMAGGGEDFDLCFTGYVNKYPDAAGQGGLLQLDDMLDDVPALREAISEDIWNDAKYADGKIYAVPNVQIFAQTVGLEIDKKLADKYELDVNSLKRAQDIEPFLEKIRDNEPDYIPIRASGLERLFIEQGDYFWGTNAYHHRETYEAYLQKTAADFRYDALKTMNEWYHKGYLRKDLLTVGDDSADYNAGRYAVAQMNWKPGVQQTQEARLGKELYIVALSEPYVKSGACRSTMTGISRSCKYPLEALKFIELVNTNLEVYRLICHGIEGKHYEKIDENTIRYIADSGYAPGADWKFGNQFNAYVLEGQPADVWDQTKQLNETAASSPVMGWSIDMTDITPLKAQVDTAVDSLPDLITCSPEEFDKLYEEMRKVANDAGLEEAEAMINKQIEDFRANN